MNINLNLKIKGGPRTPVEVDVYSTSVNEKVLKFQNGNEVKESTICNWLQKNLTESLRSIQEQQ